MSAVQILSCALAGLVVLISIIAVTAVYAPDEQRRATALMVLRILTSMLRSVLTAMATRHRR